MSAYLFQILREKSFDYLLITNNNKCQLYWMKIWLVKSSLQVMYENWAVSFYIEKQCLLPVDLKNLTTKQRKNSLQFWCSFRANIVFQVFEKLCARNYWTLTKIPRNKAKIYQETESLSSEGHLFNLSWLLPDLSFFTGCCTG